MNNEVWNSSGIISLENYLLISTYQVVLSVLTSMIDIITTTMHAKVPKTLPTTSVKNKTEDVTIANGNQGLKEKVFAGRAGRDPQKRKVQMRKACKAH